MAFSMQRAAIAKSVMGFRYEPVKGSSTETKALESADHGQRNTFSAFNSAFGSYWP